MRDLLLGSPICTELPAAVELLDWMLYLASPEDLDTLTACMVIPPDCSILVLPGSLILFERATPADFKRAPLPNYLAF